MIFYKDRCKRSRSSKAFTLVELLVVVAVLALLASIVFSNLTGAREQAKISNALSFQSNMHTLLGADLVGWWNFDEDSGNIAKDLSGYGNNGTIVGATRVDGIPGTGGKALGFSGTNQYVSIEGFQNELLHNGVTISAWIKLNEEVDNISGTILAKMSDTNGLEGFAFVKSNSYPQKIGLNLNTGGWKYSGNFLTVGSWYHVVAVLQPGSPNATVTFYANGSISGTKNQSLGKPLSDIITSNSLDIGKRSSSYFKGLIDDVRIYNVPLSSTQIMSSYYAGVESLFTRGLIDKGEYQKMIERM